MSQGWQRAGWALGIVWLAVMGWWWWTDGEQQVGPRASIGPHERCARMAAKVTAASAQPMGSAGGCALWCVLTHGPDGRIVGELEARVPGTLRGRLKCSPQEALQSLQDTWNTSSSSSR